MSLAASGQRSICQRVRPRASCSETGRQRCSNVFLTVGIPYSTSLTTHHDKGAVRRYLLQVGYGVEVMGDVEEADDYDGEDGADEDAEEDTP